MRIGTAGWSIPRPLAEAFPGELSHLERYARQLTATEINSSFYRPHRRATYERWAASVPPEFRFAVKLPRTITHDQRLVDCETLLRRFADEVAGLGDKRGPTLVQLPPSFAWPGEVALQFFATAQAVLGDVIVVEPRHASWFTPAVAALLVELRIARVAADPAVVAEAAVPGGWSGIAYFRLHGAPQIYRSPYDQAAIAEQAARVAALVASGIEVWTIYDNTASGAALGNAVALQADVAKRCAPAPG
ncbi:DUF72 domain-containing protein [Glacieibacterium sp.]|uniref:DUF72 domain-containing protein n=1 Tax=Glacieibacterium sp. TaxID=2860237 RepID=UPI003B003AC4